MMREVTGRYVEYVNYVHQQNGDVWERGFESTPIDGERHLLACHHAIEWAPVRACLVADPADYRWSSRGHHRRDAADTVTRDAVPLRAIAPRLAPLEIFAAAA